MSHVNRSVFFGASDVNSTRHVAQRAQSVTRAANSQNKLRTTQEKLIQNRSLGFQLFAETESSEQYLWSAAWFAMFILFLCTT